MRQEGKIIVHGYRQYLGAADGLSPQLNPTRCRMPSLWLDQVPGARGTGHWVEQVRPVRLPWRLVQEESVQRQTGVGHLLHALAREHVVAGHRPEQGAVDSRPCDGATFGQERWPQDGVARFPMGFGPSLHAKGARPEVREWSSSDVRTYREQSALSPEPTTSTLPKDVDFVATVAGPLGALVTGVAQERELPCALAGELN